MNTEQTHIPTNVFPAAVASLHRQRPPGGGVRQDKSASPRYSVASGQPASGTKRVLQGKKALQVGTSVDRGKKPSSRRKVPITAWYSRSLAAEIKRQAERKQLSVSGTVEALIEQALTQSLYEQEAALLRRLIKQTLHEEVRALAKRIISFLIAIFFVVSQTRQLVVNILVRQPLKRQMDEARLTEIRERSAERAKQEMRLRSPQLSALLDELLPGILGEDGVPV